MNFSQLFSLKSYYPRDLKISGISFVAISLRSGHFYSQIDWTIKKKKISANFKNILDRLNTGEDLNEITYDQLSEILLYAAEIKYVSTHSYNGNLSYRVNDRELDDECRNSILN